MKEYQIGPNDSGQRLNKFLQKAVPTLSGSMMYKYLRLKRIKVNGKRTDAAYRLCPGDVVQLYINDDYFATVSDQQAYRTITKPVLNILYEDKNILLADKPQGMVVHTDDRGETNTLIANIQAYLFQSGQWNPDDAASFAPALCNRIDRNTGGIVIAAKSAEALRILNEKIRAREIEKNYLCIVCGKPNPGSGEIHSFLKKDEEKKQIEVFPSPVSGAKSARTKYETLACHGDLSLLRCTLLTGRTHQIRAQFSSIHCPLLGDGKYGDYAENRKYGENRQALYSYSLRFSFSRDAGILTPLNGKRFTVASIPFVRKYFPDYSVT